VVFSLGKITAKPSRLRRCDGVMPFMLDIRLAVKQPDCCTLEATGLVGARGFFYWSRVGFAA
jgi:hypothetical protein